MGKGAAGFLMDKELKYLGEAVNSPVRPFVAILGGAKVSDKIEVIENLLTKVDTLLIGGAMAYTFFKSQGLPVGKSLVEDDRLEHAKAVTARAKERGVALELPVDHVVAPKLEAGAPTEVLAVTDAAIGDRMGLDIGPEDGREIRGHPDGRAHRGLERPDGGVRDPGVRARHRGRRARGRGRARGRRSSAAAIRSAAINKVGRRRSASRTSRPAAAPRSSSSAGRNCPASRRSPTR